MSPADLISPGGAVTQEPPTVAPQQPAASPSNSLLAEYRKRAPWDQRSDSQLMDIFGAAQDEDGRYAAYPDFVRQWQSMQEPSGPGLPPRQPGVVEEAGRGAISGTRSLASTAVGLAALGAGAVGAEDTKKALTNKFSQMEQQSAADGPTISRVEDITGPETAARYVFGKAGELLPNIAEAGLIGLAGAAAGTAAEPGVGTAAGGVGGALEGFVARQAAKSVLKALVENGAEVVRNAEARNIAKGEIESLVKTGVSSSLSDTTRNLLTKEATAIAGRYGANAATAANFFGQSAGGEYGNLAAQGLKDDDARTASLIAGLGGAGSIFLPAAVTKRLFPSMGEEVANDYVKRLASDAIKEIPAAATGMGLMEVANVAADRVAHPDTMDAPLTHQELMRILNASVVGAMAGGVTAPLTALKGPAQHFDPVMEEHFGNVADVRRQDIQEIKWRKENGAASLEDEAAIKAFSPEEAKFYAVASPTAPAEQGGQVQAPTLNPIAKPEPPIEAAAGAPVSPAAQPFRFGTEPVTLQAISDSPPEEFFHAKQELDKQTVGDPNAKTAANYLKEAVQANPDPGAWKEAIEKARAKGKAIKDQISALPELERGKAFQEQSTALMGSGFKASFLGDGLKAAQAFVDAETARKRAAATSATPTADPLVQAVRARAEAKLQEARQATETNPSIKQLLAENYPKGKYNLTDAGLPGMTFSLENPRGTERSPPDGSWKVTMPGDYGYLLGTLGKDKDHVDMTIGPNHEAPEVYVIDQIDPKTGDYDEAKTFLGYGSRSQAEVAYDASFSDGSGPSRRGAITTMSKAEFRDWARNPNKTTKAVSYGRLRVSEEESSALKTISQGREGDAELIRNTGVGKALASKLYSLIRGPSELSKTPGSVDASMLPLGSKLKIVDGVIESIPVSMVNDLTGLKLPTDVALHDKVVLKTLSPDAINFDANKAVGGLVPGKSADVSASAGSGHEKGKANALEKSTAKPLVARSTEPQVAPQLAGTGQAAAGEGGAGVPGGRQGEGGPAGGTPGSAQAGGKAEAAKPAEEPERTLLTKPTSPKAKTTKEKVAETEARIDEIKTQLADLLGPADESWKNRPDAGFVLNPMDLVKVINPKAIPLLTDLAHNVFKLGAYKFADFAREMVKRGGEQVIPYLASLYEASRNYWKSVLDNPKADPAEAAKAKEAMAGMTRLDKMGDAIERVADKYRGKEGPLKYDTAHVITHDDIDFEGRGVAAKSARGRDNEEVRKLWEQERKTELQTREERLKSARGKRRAALQQEQQPQLSPWEELSNYQKEAFYESLPEKTKLQIEQGRKEEVQPAWFEPSGRGEKLEKQLLSESAPPSNMANSNTYRLADILDRETGKVHRVSVFENNGIANVTRFDDGLPARSAKDRAVPLKTVMDAKGADGKPRYRVIGSLRTKGLTQYYDEAFKDEKVYRTQFGDEAKRRAQSAETTAAAMEAKVQSTGFTPEAARARIEAETARSQGEVEEGKALAPEESRELGFSEVQEASGGREAGQAQAQALPEPRPLNLEEGDIKTLRDELPPFDTVEDLAKLINTPEVSGELYDVIAKITRQDPNFFRRMEDSNLGDTLSDYGYEVDTGRRRQNEPGDVRPAQAGVRPSAVGGVSAGPKTNLEGGANRPGAVPGQVQGGARGNKIPNRATETSVTLQRARERGTMEQTLARARKHAAITSGLFPEEETRGQRPFKPSEVGPALGPEKPSHEQQPLPETSPWARLRQPGGTEGDTSPQHAALLNRIHEAAARAGIDVQTVRGELGKGAYDPKNRTLLQVLGSTIGSEDIKTAFHEVAHDVFARLPEAARAAVLRAVSKLTDRALGIDLSADSRINMADPANLGSELHEERLAESMAQNLASEGFDPARSQRFAQRFVRRVKDLFMQAAFRVQRMLGIPESPELARRYFENRVKMLLAGDSSNRSYVDFIGARKLPPWEKFREQLDPGTNTTAERFSPTGQVQYDHVPDLSTSASLFNMDANGLKYRFGDDTGKYSLRVEVEKQAAVLNHLQERIEEGVKALTPEIRKALEEAKTTPEEYIRRILRIDDPMHARELLSQERETDGSPVEFDKEKRIEDFQGKGNRDQTYIKAYSNVQGMLSRTIKQRALSDDAVKTFSKAKDKANESLANATQKLKELKAIEADKSKEIQGLPMQIGRAKQRVALARKDIAAATKAITKENLKIATIDAITPGLKDEHARLSGILEVRPDFQFTNGRKYVVPEKPEAKTEDLGKQTKTLNLDSTGELTDPASIREDLRKMKEFTAYREQRAAAGDVHALDSGYQAVNQAMHEMMARSATYSTETLPFNRWKWVHGMLPDGKRMAEAFNTPAARAVLRRLNQYTTVLERFHPLNEKGGRRTGQLEDRLLELMPKMRLEQFRKDVLDHTRDMLKNQSDLAERHANDPAAYRRAVLGRVKTDLLERHIVPDGVIDKFMPRLADLLDHQWDMAKERLAPIQEARLGVEDPRLRGVINPATGLKETAIRRHAAIGSELWGTFPRKISQGFSTMVRALRASGWQNVGDLVSGSEENPSKLRQALAEGQGEELLAPYFNNAQHGNEVRETFFRNLASMPDKSTFYAPKEFDGREALESEEEEGGAIIPRHAADPALVRQALDETGTNKPVAFAKRLFDLHGGQGDENEYVEDVVRTLSKRFSEADGMFRRYEPGDSPEGYWGIAGMSPDALIDARTIEHLPGEWFDYHAYDRRESFSMSQRIAAELAFGRGQKGLASDFETLNKEASAARTRLEEVTREVKQANPEASPKDVRHLVRDRLGADADRVIKHSERMDLIDRTVRSLSDYFRKESDPGLAMWGPTRFAHALGQLMVNQPASAINTMEQLFAMNLRYGAGGSVIGGTARTLKYFGQEAINSLAQAVGIETQFGADKYDYRTRNKLTDPDVVRSFKDAFDRQTSERPMGQLLRGIDEFTGMTFNRLGDKATHVAFKPFQPFSWVAALADYSLTRSLWDMVGTHVAKGMDYYRAHPDLLEDQAHRLDADKLGLKRTERYAFEQLTRDMGNWNMDYDTMVRDAMQRGDGKPFTDLDAQKLYGMSLANLLSESSVSTMPTSYFNNPILRFIAPLLGWSFRRSAVVAELGKTAEGKRDLIALSHGLAGLGIMAAGGLGVSAAVNMYSEDLLGKKRNLRPIVGADPEQTALGVMENLNRVGSLGLFGELANGLVNVGTGADNRVIDLDQRVVGLSALAKIQDVISSAINERDIDYAHVVRPLLGLMGGGGALQYMQLANHTLGLDNPESRAVARTNAQNWLRSVGRELDMDVRESGGGGGFANATPISPSLSRMEMAAYGNDMGDFRDAYQEAVARAKEMGNPDPVDYVKRAFAARNPLRQVFKTSPSEAEYRQILNALPSGGAQDVSDAVRIFNQFAESIGARPFEGRQQKQQPETFRLPSVGNLANLRSAAGSLMLR